MAPALVHLPLPPPLLLLLPLLLTQSAAAFDTSALDDVAFYAPSTVLASDSFGARVVAMTSLNDGLWAAANSSLAEQPFIAAPHERGVEWVLNFSAPAAAAPGAFANTSNAGGVATLPTAAGFLGIAYDVSWPECVALCFNTATCAAWAWYETAAGSRMGSTGSRFAASSGGAGAGAGAGVGAGVGASQQQCNFFAAPFGTGPQPWPSGNVLFAQGGALSGAAPAQVDAVADGLRSGAWLGGLGTGGYELRADGTFHLSTLRNQGPASEPWLGVVRDMVLAVRVNGAAHVARLAPFGGLAGVPQLVYAARVPLARLQFLGLSLYAYSPLTPGNVNSSNTPAVAFTLHARNDGVAQPMNVSFAVFSGLGLRNDWRGASASAARAPGVSSRSECAAACVRAGDACVAWQWDEAGGACLTDGNVIALGANAAGLDAGHPGVFAVSNEAAGASVLFANRVPAGLPQLHNAIGEQGLFTAPGFCSEGGCAFSYGAASGDSAEALLALLAEAEDPSTLLAARGGVGGVGGGSGAPAADGDLFAMASVTATGVTPGANASLSIVHSWHFPRYFWYRDAFSGSDNGVRYAINYASASDVPRALNLTVLAGNLRDWQAVYAGLPDPLLSDAAFNLFAHARSSMWFLRDAEYRQWESLEFTDFLNPTNGDERHLPYFHVAPAAMRSQLRTMAAHSHNADGSFYCVVVSAAHDAQFGAGDPCPPQDHPDDVAMFLVGLYELYALANDTALAAELYPAVVAGLDFYAKSFNSTAWGLPYQVHETYDAVPLSPTITGEGNLGTSLYNSLNYLTALNCVARLADAQGDAASAAQARALLARATASVERNLWQPGALPAFVGDTLQGYALFTEPTNGWPYKSSDGLHGQVLAYRLGFGDLLPRLYMQLHQRFATGDLDSPFGLSFSSFSGQNWVMSDHSNAALRLRWNDVRGFDTSLRQVRYWRETRRELTRSTAVVYTGSGMYGLLNYYGYALFFFHTLSAFSGQTADLPARTISFRPHFSAFSAAGEAAVPLLLGGSLGKLSISPAEATLSAAFLDEGAPLSFLEVRICQHVFAAGPYELSAPGAALRFALPAPCDTSQASSASTAASANYGVAAPAPNASATATWAQALGTAPLQGVTRAECLAYVAAHVYCGYAFDAASSKCWPVPGVACYLVDAPPRAAAAPAREVGFVSCSYASAGYSPPAFVNTSSTAFFANASFSLGFAPLDSPVFSAVLPGFDACAALAARQQACGYLWAPRYAGPVLGSCGPAAMDAGCCVLNPTSPASGGCAPGSPLDPAVWGAGAVLGLFDGENGGGGTR